MKRFALVTLIVLGAIAMVACHKNKNVEESSTGKSNKESQNATPGAVTEFFVESTFEQAEELVKEMTLEEKIGQMFLVAMPEEYDVTAKSKKQKKKLQTALKKTHELIKTYHLGGIYLTEKNIETQKQTTELVSGLQACVSGGALYMAVEEEGGGNHSISGRVKNLKEGGYMTQSEMGENMTVEHVQKKSTDVAAELSDWGINLNLAPVADLAAGQVVSYDMRCYGTDADITADFVSSAVTGMHEGGLAVTLKHFPGFGDATGDYTEEILNNENSLMKLRSDEFSVYEEGIKAGADCVMVGSMSVSKITVKEIPAFLSTDIVTSILREELGFEGVVMTPPLNEGVITKNYTSEYVAVEAVKAGCDMIVMPENLEESYEALLSEVRSGRLDEKVINTAVCRILQNKIERGILVLENSDE